MEEKVLVVGGAGFVGSCLVRLLLQQPRLTIHIIDNLLSSERENIPDNPCVSFTEGSISDDAIVNALQDEYNTIYHLATYHGNQSSIHDPLADHQNNTLTTLKLFEQIKQFKKVKKVVYAGAGCAVAEKTFGQAHATVESDLVSLDMDSPYSMSKIFGEFYSKYYFRRHSLPVVRARFQNVYGPGEVLGAGKWRGTMATVWRNVVPTFIYQAIKRIPLTVQNRGIATRDFIYVEDIARGLIACAERGTPGEAYNLATGIEIPIIELANAINTLTGNPSPITFLPKRDWDNSGCRFGCPKKAKEELGFTATHTLQEGLKTTVAWTKEHLEWIDRTIQKHEKYFAPELVSHGG